MKNTNCWYCYFYKSGYMENACDYFGLENFCIQNTCDAFSVDGYVAPELEDKIFKESNGVYGKPLLKKMNDLNMYEFKDCTNEQYTCEECKYNNRQWYEMPCDACCGAHSGFERKEDNNNERTQSVSM